MLLNLSNHPSTHWPENQLQVAHKNYGEVRDIPFPQIDPKADENAIQDLAEQYLQKILDIQPIAVHLMGELNFTFELVSRLKSHGITCLASTTHRTSELRDDGAKFSRFEFVRFRKY